VQAAISATWDPSQTLVAGHTITGSVYRLVPGAAGGHLSQSIAFPARAPVATISSNFAADGSAITSDDDATCTGSYSAPTAPPGQVCGYLGISSNVSDLHLDNLSPGQDKGFIVRVQTMVAGETLLGMTWAYTAPA
jgi:hypothetical protein